MTDALRNYVAAYRRWYESNNPIEDDPLVESIRRFYDEMPWSDREATVEKKLKIRQDAKQRYAKEANKA